MKKIRVAVMAVMAICMSGCFPFGMSASHETPPMPLISPEATVEVGEVLFETAPTGCIESISELPDSDVYSRDNPYLQSDHLIVVLKEARRLMLFQNGKIRHDRTGGAPDCWKIALGIYTDGRPSGALDKTRQGDRHTPTGLFRTSDKPWSQYQDAILIHYPSPRHAAAARDSGRIADVEVEEIHRAHINGVPPPQDTPLGGEILIHGGGSQADWTWGCIALNDNDLTELRALLPGGMKTWMLILP